MHRKKFLSLSSLGLLSISSNGNLPFHKTHQPMVLSTWDVGMEANKVAWEILSTGGNAIDAVEKGVMAIEDTINCCVGLGANPDREGFVTLDAAIMNHQYQCGSVAALERIKHPISVARKVMELTPHVMLTGMGAQQFALSQGFNLESEKLSPEAERSYKEWLKKSEYKPIINIENMGNHFPAPPTQLENGEWNHDTIGMIAIDSKGNLSGSCTTSGQGFKMRGRIGDSPIIGAGLYVDNEVGAAVASGQGEEIIKICGCHLVVEMMRLGYSPEKACKIAVERIYKINGTKAKNIQAGFIALNKKGVWGSYALQKNFSVAIRNKNENNLKKIGHLI